MCLAYYAVAVVCPTGVFYVLISYPYRAGYRIWGMMKLPPPFQPVQKSDFLWYAPILHVIGQCNTTFAQLCISLDQVRWVMQTFSFGNRSLMSCIWSRCYVSWSSSSGWCVMLKLKLMSWLQTCYLNSYNQLQLWADKHSVCLKAMGWNIDTYLTFVSGIQFNGRVL